MWSYQKCYFKNAHLGCACQGGHFAEDSVLKLFFRKCIYECHLVHTNHISHDEDKSNIVSHLGDIVWQWLVQPVCVYSIIHSVCTNARACLHVCWRGNWLYYGCVRGKGSYVHPMILNSLHHRFFFFFQTWRFVCSRYFTRTYWLQKWVMSFEAVTI